jgi:hypothetical protein
LPLHLKASETKNYGLFYVFPVNGRYIAVNSGIPWWTGKGLSSWYLPQPQMSINDYKDFALYKSSAGNVVSEGFFDNNWKLTEEKKKELGASSVLGF